MILWMNGHHKCLNWYKQTIMANKIFKQACFNELSVEPVCKSETEKHDRMVNFVNTIKKANDVYGTKLVRYQANLCDIHLDEKDSIQDYCTKNIHNPEVGVILSSQTSPQVDLDDDIIAEKYIETKVTIEKDGSRIEAEGFTAAFVYDTFAIGFDSDEFWANPLHKIQVASNGQTLDTEWPCLSRPEHVEEDTVGLWVDAHSELELVKSTLSVQDKTVNLRDDHGKDILAEHAKRLLKNDYVDRILTSLPFKPTSTTYIDKINPDGTIDIVLFWTDRGLSMRVKTTGRNIQETQAIADILRRKYGHS